MLPAPKSIENMAKPETQVLDRAVEEQVAEACDCIIPQFKDIVYHILLVLFKLKLNMNFVLVLFSG